MVATVKEEMMKTWRMRKEILAILPLGGTCEPSR